MFNNYDFYKKLLDTKNVLDNYSYFEKILKEEPNDIYAQDGIKFCLTRKLELENTCEQHIPVVLKINKNTKVYNYMTNEYVPVKFRRCLCCGRLLPFETDMKNDINITIDDNIVDYDIFDKKYMELLNLAIDIANNSINKQETIKNFREAIDDYDVKIYTIKRKIN